MLGTAATLGAFAAAVAASGTAPAAAAGCAGANLLPGRQSVGHADEAILCLVNEERAQAGFPALRPDAPLGSAATQHSRDMVARGYFGHYDPSGGGPGQRARAAGFCRTGCAVSENLAWGTGPLGTPSAIVSAWMRSVVHRANILAPRVRLTGIGVVWGSPGQGIGGATVTQDFG